MSMVMDIEISFALGRHLGRASKVFPGRLREKSSLEVGSSLIGPVDI